MSKRRIPSYRLHKPSGQAIVRLNGRMSYLGKHGTDASRQKYDRLIAEWLAQGRMAAEPTPDGSRIGAADNDRCNRPIIFRRTKFNFALEHHATD